MLIISSQRGEAENGLPTPNQMLHQHVQSVGATWVYNRQGRNQLLIVHTSLDIMKCLLSAVLHLLLAR